MNNLFYQVFTLQDSDFPFSIEQGSFEEHDECFSMHWHESMEIIYVHSGSAVILVEVNAVEVQAGDIVVINTNMLHSIRVINKPFAFSWIEIDKSFCLQNKIDIDNTVFRTLIKDNVLIEMIQSIICECNDKKSNYKTMVRAHMIRFLVLLTRQYGDINSTFDFSMNHKLTNVKNTLTYIRGNFKQRITIDMICKNVGLSKYYICHSFKEVTGKTIMEHVNHIRCIHAKKLLTSGQFNVLETLEKCGFNNAAYFSQVYKRYMGAPPSQDMKADV